MTKPASDLSFAVIIPTTGRQELSRALDSVRHQTFTPRQVIVVDNGPAEAGDPTRAETISAEWSDLEGLTVITIPPLSGQSIARNLGAWQAATSHVAFLDDDDAYGPGFLAAMADRITATDPDVMYGTLSIHDAAGNHQRDKRLDRFAPSEWLDRMYSQKNDGFSGQNLCVRREVFFEVGGFPVDLRTAEDRLFAIRCLKAGVSVAYVDDAVVQVYVPQGQRSRLEPTRWQACLKILVEYWDDMPWGVRWTSARKTFKAWAIWVVKRRRARRASRRS